MRTLFARSRLVVMSSCLVVWGMLYACTASEDENPATTRRTTGDSGTIGNGNVDVDGSTTEPTGAPICAKYGGVFGVNAIATNILNAARTDCRISINFNDADVQHTQDCFQAFVAGGFQCPGVSYVQGTTTDAKKQRCESFLGGVNFSAKDFQAFADFNSQSIVLSALTSKGLTADELKSLAVVFEGKKGSVLDPQVPQGKYTQCTATCATGGEACIQPIIDAGPDTGPPPPDAGNDAGDAGDGGP